MCVRIEKREHSRVNFWHSARNRQPKEIVMLSFDLAATVGRNRHAMLRSWSNMREIACKLMNKKVALGLNACQPVRFASVELLVTKRVWCHGKCPMASNTCCHKDQCVNTHTPWNKNSFLSMGAPKLQRTNVLIRINHGAKLIYEPGSPQTWKGTPWLQRTNLLISRNHRGEENTVISVPGSSQPPKD